MGENISAREVEDLLYEHDQVEDVAVIGLPDADTGGRCRAIVLRRNAYDPLEFTQMVAFLEGHKLMKQKIPEQLELVAEMPRNATGKILKAELARATCALASGGSLYP
ncbi:MAG: cyclohexanecarboxylate-CoA ligase [bacterium]|nr:cyclohexanecarboxylate-CoA ligase [bacterium]